MISGHHMPSIAAFSAWYADIHAFSLLYLMTLPSAGSKITQYIMVKKIAVAFKVNPVSNFPGNFFSSLYSGCQ